MNYTHFIGIDVSKDTLDFTILQDQKVLKQDVVENNRDGVLCLLKQVKAFVGKDLSNALFCMEHTDIYNQHLLDLSTQKGLRMVLESAIHIQRSSGLVRGKTDKTDAHRIALYAAKNSNDLVCWEAPREVIKKLKVLTGIRGRLISAIKILAVPSNETKGFDKKAAKLMEYLVTNSLKKLKQDLENTEKQIKKVIEEDPSLKKLFNQITSVDGIGIVTAVGIIVTTNEFKNFKTASQYACYSGVAPFEHSSGTSVKGKTRVSHHANKKIKTLIFK